MSNQLLGGLNPDSSRMFRVRKTCLKMLNNRGYIVDEAAINMTTGQYIVNNCLCNHHHRIII